MGNADGNNLGAVRETRKLRDSSNFGGGEIVKDILLNDLRPLLGVVDVDYCEDENAFIDLTYDPEELKFTIIYEVQDSWARALAWSDFKVKPESRPKALDFCNEWNSVFRVPRAFLQHDNFTIDWGLPIDREISEEYLKENFVELFRAAVDWFAEAVEEEFDAERDFED